MVDKNLCIAARHYGEILMIPVESTLAHFHDAQVFRYLIGAYIESSKDVVCGSIRPERWWALKCWFAELFEPMLGEVAGKDT